MSQKLRRLLGLGYSRWTECSFCRKYHSQVARLIDGRKCAICNECVVVCFNLLAEELGEGFQEIDERAQAVRRGAVEGELKWLKEQMDAGRITEAIFQERQRLLILGDKKAEQVGAPNPATRRESELEGG